MKLLIDTNVVIKLEVADPQAAEVGTPEALEIQRIAQLDRSISLVVHPAIHIDIDQDRDAVRRGRTRYLVENRYYALRNPPTPERVEAELGTPNPGSNDWVDHRLMAAVLGGAADYLVTDDAALRGRLNRLAGRDVALSIAATAEMLRSLFDRPRVPPPRVIAGAMYSLDPRDPIWDSFREDYSGFDEWFDRSRGDESRQAWWVGGDDGLAAVVVVKPEASGEVGLSGRVLKISSMKVSELARGQKLGELLLKTVFDFAHANRYDHIYLTVFAHHGDLIALLQDFGFRALEDLTQSRELVLAKTLQPSSTSASEMTALDFHITYGPPAIRPGAAPVFIVPIQPTFHDLLFPELAGRAATPQMVLDLDLPDPVPTRPFGNAIKKAYLSNASVRSIGPGDILLFYRSHDQQTVTVIGVVEDVRVSIQPDEIAAFVGPRTVYSFEEIEGLCIRGEVVAILFRQDRGLESPIGLDELKDQGALRAAPQSITSAREEGVEWLRSRIEK